VISTAVLSFRRIPQSAAAERWESTAPARHDSVLPRGERGNLHVDALQAAFSAAHRAEVERNVHASIVAVAA